MSQTPVSYAHASSGIVIDVGRDACSFEEWLQGGANSHPCARHPDGFLVFLGPDELGQSDEYGSDDPYSVSDNIDSAFHQRRFEVTVDLIKRHAPSNLKRVLDLGCGEGHLTARIQSDTQATEVFGLDYSISAIQHAQKNFQGIEFAVADGFMPPYPDSHFDVVVCNNIWEHVPDPLRLLEGIARVLAPHGLIVISTPSRYRFGNVLRILVGVGVKMVSTQHVTEYSVGQVIEQLRFGGFEVREMTSPVIRERNFILTAAKKAMAITARLLRSSHVLEATVFYAASPVGEQD